MRVVIIGSVESTRVCLKALDEASGFEIAALVTLPTSLAHRHSDFVDMTAEAGTRGIKTILAPNCNSPDVVEQCRDLRADYLFVVGWSQICRPPLLATARKGAIGYHPAALPRMRGRAVIPWTILLDEKITGGSLFWIDDGVDSGPLLAQRFFHVAPDETATTLYSRHMSVLGDMMDESIAALQSPNPPRIAQDDRYATYCAKRTPADGKIDWSKPAREVDRLIRAVTRPYPGAFTSSPKGQLFIWQSSFAPTRHSIAALPGQITERNDSAFAVRCGDGHDLWITDFSFPEGSDTELPLHTVLS